MRASFIIICVLLPFSAGVVKADTIKIPTDYPTIQEGIDAAVNGDTVLVAPGTYVENIDFNGKAITVQSEQGPLTTVIDGSNPLDPDFGSVVSFSSGEGPDSVLEGFTLKNGTGNNLDPGQPWGPYCGGGIFCVVQSSPKLVNNVITSNIVENNGGGLYIANSDPTLIDCTFSHNKAYVYYSYGEGGGGIYLIDSNPRIINCTFTMNYSEWDGGGICNDGGSPELTDCSFTLNVNLSSGGGFYNRSGSPALTNCSFIQNDQSFSGGGFYNKLGNPILTDCMFIENGAFVAGGGVHSWEDGSITLNRCTFIGNRTDGGGGAVDVSWGGGSLTMNHCSIIKCSASYGGGIYGYTGASLNLNGCTFIGNTAINGGAIETYTDMSLINCTFIENSAWEKGGAMLTRGQINPELINCSFGGNKARPGGALYNMEGSSPVVVNCILWADLPDEIFDDTGSESIVTYSCIQGGYPGLGNIDADPQFVDPYAYDGHLTFNSPCRGSGDNSVPGLPESDFEGDPRIYQGTVDMGADEFYTHLYVTGDQTQGGNIQGKFVGLPGTSPVRLFISLGGVRPTPLPTPYGDLWLLPPRLSIPLVPIPSNGILVIPATIPASPAAPYDIPMQGLVGLNSDSLTNLCLLEVR